MNRQHSRNSWGLAGLVTLALVLLLLVTYRETLQHVTAAWNDWDVGGFYGHGYLVLAISFFLLYRQRHTLAQLTPSASPTALLAIAGSSLVWLAATVTGVLVIQVIVLLLLIFLVAWASLGIQVARYLAFPLFILVFAIPIWDPLPPVLQKFTADTAFWIARLISIPVFRQEQLLILPAGQISIDESCSGIGYLLAALTLGTLYAYLYYRTLWSRLLVVMIAGCAAILANIIRVVIVVQQAYVTDMQTHLIKEHYNLGWLLFAGLVILLLLLDHSVPRHAGSVKTMPLSKEVEELGMVRGQEYFRHIVVLIATGMLLLSGPVVIWWSQKPDESAQMVPVVLPMGAAGWSGPLESSDGWMPVFHGAVNGIGGYQKDGRKLYLYIGYYPKQEQGSELIYYQNRISNEDLWQTTSFYEHVVDIGMQTVLEQKLKSISGGERLVWYWYRVAGFDTTNRYMAKILQLLGIITGKPEASIIAVAGDIETPDLARHAMRDFIFEMGPSLSVVVDGGPR